jgi:hypothetical protein
LRPTWSHIELQGIFDVTLALSGTPTSSSIKFTVSAGCAGEDVVTALEDANVKLYNADGTLKTHTFVAADANGVYELTGTGFANGMYINLNGVVQQTEATYESTGALTIAGIV